MALRGVSEETSAASAVAALHEAHYRDLVRLAALLLDDVGASEEVVQDAFVSLQVGWGRLRRVEAADAWLRTAVLNGARSRMRRRQSAARHPAPAPGTAPSAEAGAMEAREHDRVLAALALLPERQREALVLRFYLDLSEAEMADAMVVSRGSIKTHVHRGLAALETMLEDQR
ncbi:MAG TPA: SigE family RNA polymerase sigma factor [Acidimicrobiales bacterium]|nr:SigE family RNA polymerase sigma factor [Acidimicrobiales bacterium]